MEEKQSWRDRFEGVTFKKLLVRYIVSAFISVGIGTCFLYYFCPACILNLKQFAYNASYSIMLGVALYNNQLVVRFFAGLGISWMRAPVKSSIWAFVVTLSYSSAIIWFINWFWYVFLSGFSWKVFLANDGGEIIIGEYILLFVFGGISYARAFFIEWKSAFVESEALKREALKLQYEVLSSQVSPHFLFNSLNVLTSLIDLDREKAKRFVKELSLFYRDLLGFKDQQVVAVAKELTFLKRYLFLQHIRFGNKFEVVLDVENPIGYLVPLTLQVLVENVFKHNVITKANPLLLKICVTHHQTIVVENTLQKKKGGKSRTGIGLVNLKERYHFLTGRHLTVRADNGVFMVEVPIIKEVLA